MFPEFNDILFSLKILTWLAADLALLIMGAIYIFSIPYLIVVNREFAECRYGDFPKLCELPETIKEFYNDWLQEPPPGWLKSVVKAVAVIMTVLFVPWIVLGSILSFKFICSCEENSDTKDVEDAS